jgi:hypothetical protein
MLHEIAIVCAGFIIGSVLTDVCVFVYFKFVRWNII